MEPFHIDQKSGRAFTAHVMREAAKNAEPTPLAFWGEALHSADAHLHGLADSGVRYETRVDSGGTLTARRDGIAKVDNWRASSRNQTWQHGLIVMPANEVSRGAGRNDLR